MQGALKVDLERAQKAKSDGVKEVEEAKAALQKKVAELERKEAEANAIAARIRR